MIRKIVAIITKEMKIRFASPSEWLFFLILPVVFTLILSGGTGGQSDIDMRIRFSVVDQAQSSLSKQLILALHNSDAVLAEMQTLEKAERLFAQRQIPALLIIPPTFTLENVINAPQAVELRQQLNNMDAQVVEQVVTTHIAYLSSPVDTAQFSAAQAEMIKPFDTESDRETYIQNALALADQLTTRSPTMITMIEGDTKDNVDYNPGVNSSAGQLITWVFIPLIGLSSIFAYERQNGTLKRILISPTQKATYLLGTILAHVMAALVQMLLLIGFGMIILKVNWGRSPGALFILMTVAALAAAALGTTLGTLVKTSGQATGLSIMTGMLMALFGGCWYPIELFPRFIQQAVKILPTTWAMQGLLNLVLRGQSYAGIWLPTVVLLGFATLFFTIGVWRFKMES